MINAAADDANFRQESCPGLTTPPPATYHLRRMSPCALCAGRKALPCFLSCWVSEVPCVWQPLLGNKNQADLNQFIINHNLFRTHERSISQLFWGLPCSILTSSYLIRPGYILDPRGSLSLPSSNHPRTEASWIRPTFRRKIMPCCRDAKLPPTRPCTCQWPGPQKKHENMGWNILHRKT